MTTFLDRFEYTKGGFLRWFFSRYSLPEHAFIVSPLERKIEVILEFLGYPAEIPSAWKKENWEEEIKKIIYLYEVASAKYQCPEDDFFVQIKSMSFKERKEVLPGIDSPANIKHGLNEALIPLSENKQIRGPGLRNRERLSDSITDLIHKIVRSVEPDIQDKFWENLKVTKVHEKAPF